MTPKALTGPVKPNHSFGEFLHTRLQWRLELAANAILAKAGFFPEGEVPEDEYDPVEANAVGSNGLRPTWHGKAA